MTPFLASVVPPEYSIELEPDSHSDGGAHVLSKSNDADLEVLVKSAVFSPHTRTCVWLNMIPTTLSGKTFKVDPANPVGIVTFHV